MKFLGRFLFFIFSNLLAILIASYFIKGFIFKGGFKELLTTAFVFTIFNLALRPILKLLFGPLIVLTFGLFTIVINVLILYLLDFFIEFLIIEGYQPLILATFLISGVNFFINLTGKWAFKE